VRFRALSCTLRGAGLTSPIKGEGIFELILIINPPLPWWERGRVRGLTEG